MATKSIIIKSKKYGTHELIVDEDDFELVNSKKWHVNSYNHKSSKNMYASTEIFKGNVRTQIRVHRFLLGGSFETIDHIDGNGLNNSRSNLRGCTQKQNVHNSKTFSRTGFKGVWYIASRSGKKKYHSQLMVDGKKKFIGYFEDPIEAALAYNEEVKKHRGEFARLNTIPNENRNTPTY